ncbi:importin-9-like [Xenia sp. Carnegie-2017]|uniref:importin-9-like n=1 Tax=Xenia sp. Carnegie-2017 TaxID=2897299 RepID=UPI001F04A503|nr:importin-9-like [Xenia sp. Carnegie-2017]
MEDQLCNDNMALREALIECLSHILSPEQQLRLNAEERLKLLEVTEDYGIHLAQLSVDENSALPIRQLASVILKQYVQSHWMPISEKFTPPVTPSKAKAAIREILPHGLKDPISKVRLSVAYAMSAIAHWDWPEAWPDLFGTLMQALLSEDHNFVHGAMRVLTEFSSEVTDAQISQVAPIILPQMCLILTEDVKYHIRTRSRAVSIFNTFAELIGSSCSKSVRKQLFPVMKSFPPVLTQVLAVPDGETSDCGLKMEVLKALTTLIEKFPKEMASQLSAVLPHVWNILTHGAERYHKTVINFMEEADDPVDSDGEILTFEAVVFQVFEFIQALVESRFKVVVKTHLDQLLYFLLVYMEITEDQACIWMSDPNRFVEDEDDDTFSFSVRISAQNLLLTLASEMKDETAACLVQALSKHLHESRTAKSNGDQFWWKVDESCMLAIGSVQPLISEKILNGELQFDVPGFLTEVVLVALNDSSASPFLIGRALWFSSRFTCEMTPELLARFLEGAVNGLRETQVPAIRIGAARATYGFCDRLKSSGNAALFNSYLPDAINSLINMSTQFREDVLSLVLETLWIILGMNKEITAAWEEKISPLVVAMFLKHGNDPQLNPIIEGLFKELAYNEACLPLLQERFLPTLVNLLDGPHEKVPLGYRAVAMDILCHIIRGSASGLSNALVNNVFPVLVSFILRSDDNAILQSGGECVRAFVSKGSEQLLNWQDSSSNNGLTYVIRVISHILHPGISEYASVFVGKLIIILVKKVGNNLGEKLDTILRESLSKLQNTQTLTVIQSLMMVFISLMYHRLEDTLNFLSNVPDPSGKSALDFIINIWCNRQQEFHGAFDSKVRILALCKMLEHFVNSGDRRLSDIIVKGDRHVELETEIRTRSKAAKQPEHWTHIQAPVKFFKLLIDELSNMNQSTDEIEEITDDEDWDDEDEISECGDLKNIVGSSFAPASDFPGFDFMFDFPVEEVEDDPDVLEDPIYSMDIQNYLVEYLVAFSRHPTFTSFNNGLNSHEKQTLARILQM